MNLPKQPQPDAQDDAKSNVQLDKVELFNPWDEQFKKDLGSNDRKFDF